MYTITLVADLGIIAVAIQLVVIGKLIECGLLGYSVAVFNMC